MAVIGIDLGTTNSLACVYRDGKPELIPTESGSFITKSCVSLLEDGSVAVGTAARDRLISHPEQTAASFKTWMGAEKELFLGNQKFLPHELSALVLKKIAKSAQGYLEELFSRRPALASGGDRKSRLILHSSLSMTEEEIQAVLNRIGKLQIQWGANEGDYRNLVRAERLFAELTGPEREQAAWLIRAYRTDMLSGGPAARQRRRAWMEGELRQLEHFLDYKLWDDRDENRKKAKNQEEQDV